MQPKINFSRSQHNKSITVINKTIPNTNRNSNRPMSETNPSPSLTEVFRLNNIASALLLQGNFRDAILSLREAMQVMKTFFHDGSSLGETSQNFCCVMHLTETIPFIQSTEFFVFSRAIAIEEVPEADRYINTPTGKQVIDDSCENIETLVSMILLFNLALSYHGLGSQGIKSSPAFKKALSLLGLIRRIADTSSCSDELIGTVAVLASNNEAIIHHQEFFDLAKAASSLCELRLILPNLMTKETSLLSMNDMYEFTLNLLMHQSAGVSISAPSA
jgi:hypothetical protein